MFIKSVCITLILAVLMCMRPAQSLDIGDNGYLTEWQYSDPECTDLQYVVSYSGSDFDSNLYSADCTPSEGNSIYFKYSSGLPTGNALPSTGLKIYDADSCEMSCNALDSTITTFIWMKIGCYMYDGSMVSIKCVDEGSAVYSWWNVEVTNPQCNASSEPEDSELFESSCPYCRTVKCVDASMLKVSEASPLPIWMVVGLIMTAIVFAGECGVVLGLLIHVLSFDGTPKKWND